MVDLVSAQKVARVFTGFRLTVLRRVSDDDWRKQFMPVHLQPASIHASTWSIVFSDSGTRFTFARMPLVPALEPVVGLQTGLEHRDITTLLNC